MDFLDRMMDFVEGNLQLFSIMRKGPLDENSMAISVLPTPSTAIIRYFDKSKDYNYGFQVLVKHPTQSVAIQTIEDIVNLLDGVDGDKITSDDNTFSLVVCNVYTLPTFVEITEHNEYIYTALFQADLFI